MACYEEGSHKALYGKVKQKTGNLLLTALRRRSFYEIMVSQIKTAEDHLI